MLPNDRRTWWPTANRWVSAGRVTLTLRPIPERGSPLTRSAAICAYGRVVLPSAETSRSLANSTASPLVDVRRTLAVGVPSSSSGWVRVGPSKLAAWPGRSADSCGASALTAPRPGKPDREAGWPPGGFTAILVPASETAVVRRPTATGSARMPAPLTRAASSPGPVSMRASRRSHRSNQVPVSDRTRAVSPPKPPSWPPASQTSLVATPAPRRASAVVRACARGNRVSFWPCMSKVGTRRRSMTLETDERSRVALPLGVSRPAAWASA